MLSLRLELLTGRYVACAFNDRDRAEWPPHPARVFSALVAALHEGEASEPERGALRWLETLPPPALCFSPASVRDLKVFYVPVNDKALTDKATVSNAWAKVLASDQTPKQKAKAEARLSEAYVKAGERQAKLPKDVREVVDHLLPPTRTKQPRTFPSVTPEEPVVWLCWEAEPDPLVADGLRSLLRRMVRLGHSSSMVAACIVDDAAPEPTLVPDSEGPQVLRWVGPGQLAALEALHAAAPYSEQRVMPYVVARYRRAGPRVETVHSTFASDFIALRRVAGPRLPVLATEHVADAVRKALMAHAEDPRAPLLSGHDSGGGPLQDDHLAVVPLPFVDARHATGDLLGVALVPPAGCSRDDLRPLHVALGRWEASFGERGDGPRCQLTLSRLGKCVLERSLDPSPLHNLRETTWSRPSQQWVSVTPILLDRHPGSLRDAKPSARRRAVRRANETIVAACERIGLPAPERIELLLDPPVRGTEPAPRFAAHRRGREDHRPLVHVRLTFPQPVAGPVLLGAGRYRGLGLLRPVIEEASS